MVLLVRCHKYLKGKTSSTEYFKQTKSLKTKPNTGTSNSWRNYDVIKVYSSSFYLLFFWVKGFRVPSLPSHSLLRRLALNPRFSPSISQVWGSQAHATMSSLFCLWSGAEDKTQGLVSRNHEIYHWATPQNWKLFIRKQDESILWLVTIPHTSGNFKLSWECVLAGSGAGNQHTTHLCVSEPVFIIQSVLLHSCQL